MKPAKRFSNPFLLIINAFLLFLAITLYPLSLYAAQNSNDETTKDVLQQYLIGSGDILEISVWNEPNLNKISLVRLDGRISLPLVGEILVSGMSPKDLSFFLTHKFSRFVSGPNVSVILKESKSKRYYIVGQISKPGEYSIDYQITVLQAIARAGGFLEWAKRSSILIVRRIKDKEIIYNFDYESVIKGKNLAQNIKISPGDTLVIP